jgi:flagellar motility protein MotE (MotC chaperone)
MTRAHSWRAGQELLPGGRAIRSVVVVLAIAVGAAAVARLAAVAQGIFDLAAAGSAPLAAGKADHDPPEPIWAPLPEPAAGPDLPPPDAPLAQAPATPPGPGASDPRVDPARLTASEMALLHQLAARREALDQRARALDQREALIATAQASLEAQITRLAELRAEITAVVERHDAAEDGKLTSLIKIYETMKPKAAAEIFDRLEMPVLIRVVERMREAKSADVLARMDPVKAKQVTTELARRTKLLQAGRAAAATAAGQVPASDG